MINESKAREMVESIKDKEVAYVQYLGVKVVPYTHIKTPYKFFPDELKNQRVHVFEGLSSTNEKVSVALCQYYVDMDGNIYKDTYPSSLKCIRMK